MDLFWQLQTLKNQLRPRFNSQRWHQSEISMKKKTMLYIWWDQKDVVYELLKSGQTITGDLYWEQIIRFESSTKTDQNTKRDSTKWFCFITTASHHKICQGNVRSTSLGSATSCGLFTRLCPFRLPCFGRWHLLRNISIFMKMSKNRFLIR